MTLDEAFLSAAEIYLETSGKRVLSLLGGWPDADQIAQFMRMGVEVARLEREAGGRPEDEPQTPGAN